MAELEESHSGLAAALAAFQATMPVVAKGETADVPTKAGGRFTYTYASLADITKVAMPLLAAQGLSFTCAPDYWDRGLVLRGHLIHSSGEERVGTLPLTGDTPQQLGSSITYMRRYLLGCMTGIVTDDDDDGHEAQQAQRRPRESTRPQVPTTPPGPPPHRTPPPTRPRESGPYTEAQFKLYRALLKAKGAPPDRAERLAWVSGLIGRDIGSSTEMNSRELSKVIDTLNEMPDAIPSE